MFNKKKKSIIKESGVTEGLPTSKAINKFNLSPNEQLIKDMIEKSLKGYTVETIQTPADSMFYNINLSVKKDDIDSDDLELQRFLIAQQLSNVRSELFEVLSKELPIVNIKSGPYSFSKNDNILCFAVTILLSNTDIKEWVTGRLTKNYNKDRKEELKKEDNMMESISIRRRKNVLSNKNTMKVKNNKNIKKSKKSNNVLILESLYEESHSTKNINTKNISHILESIHKSVSNK